MRYLYLTLVALLFTASAGAQSFLHFQQTLFGMDTVTTASDSIHINDVIYNDSSITYSQTVYVHAYLKNALVDTNITGDSIIDSTFLPSLTPIDTGSNGHPFTISIIANPPLFEVGPPIGIVIWPVYQGGQAGPNDSLRLSVVVTYPLGISGSPLSRAYVYQIGNRLNINFGDAENLVQQVRIYDIEGQMMYSASAQASQSIPTNGWQRGIYFCELTTYSGERKTFKVIMGE